jgi:hypothetical protein
MRKPNGLEKSSVDVGNNRAEANHKKFKHANYPQQPAVRFTATRLRYFFVLTSIKINKRQPPVVSFTLLLNY